MGRHPHLDFSQAHSLHATDPKTGFRPRQLSTPQAWLPPELSRLLILNLVRDTVAQEICDMLWSSFSKEAHHNSGVLCRYILSGRDGTEGSSNVEEQLDLVCDDCTFR